MVELLPALTDSSVVQAARSVPSARAFHPMLINVKPEMPKEQLKYALELLWEVEKKRPNKKPDGFR